MVTRLTTDSKYWKCPNCGEVLEKGGLNVFISPGQDSGKIIGTATCGKCQAGFPQSDVYGGTYDFVGERAPDRSSLSARPTGLRVLVLREGEKPPPEPQQYCEQIVYERYGDPPPATKEWNMIGSLVPPNAEQTAVLYSQLRATKIPDYGRPTDEFECTGSDGAKVAALFFWEA